MFLQQQQLLFISSCRSARGGLSRLAMLPCFLFWCSTARETAEQLTEHFAAPAAALSASLIELCAFNNQFGTQSNPIQYVVHYNITHSLSCTLTYKFIQFRGA